MPPSRRDDDFARGSYSGIGPRSDRRADERIREDVCDRMTIDDDLDASDIEVSVADGVVTLDGSVADREAKRAAERLADTVRGVRDVQNFLRLRS